MENIKVVDLFSGVGGLSYGFEKDDFFEIIAANEILDDMAKAYNLNYPKVKMYNTDIKNLTYAQMKNDLGEKAENIQLLIGGPPCQSFSTLGKRLLNDPRGNLFKEYYRLLKEIKPKMFVFENVKGLISMKKGEILDNILMHFKELGYNVKYKLLNAVNFGIPQFRERIIIVGSLYNKEFQYPVGKYNEETQINLFNDVKNYITLKEALSDLPHLKSGENSILYSSDPITDYQREMRGKEHILTNHEAPNHNQKLINLMEALPDGGTPQDIPKDLRPKSGFKNTYCKLWWGKPSYTITRNFGTPSSSRCIHPIDSRALTTREGARLQSFPDDYIFYGSRSSKNLQIGNAVPPKLSIAIKESIKKYFIDSL